MKHLNSNRRIFLKQMLTASVFTAACPHILLGELNPTIQDTGNGTILGTYSLDIEQYPVLKEIWGSVRLNIPTDIGGTPEEVIITRVPFDTYKQHFSAFNTKCPHEGQRVYDLHPDLHIFICSGHGTEFNPLGTYLDGPAAQDLLKYTVDRKWLPGDRFLKISFPFYTSSVNDKAEDVNSPLFFLRKNHPNPFIDYTNIEYGIESDMYIKIAIYDIGGNAIHTIYDGFQLAGTYSHRFEAQNSPAGMYICKLSVNGEEKSIIKMIKQ